MRTLVVVVMLVGCDRVFGLDDPKDPPPGPRTWVVVAAGDHATCAIDRAQQLFCWGSNGHFQLGASRPETEVDEPVLVAGEWTAVDVGSQSACAIKIDGTLWCWGTNFAGQLAQPLATTVEMAPVRVDGAAPTWTEVSVEQNHACAVGGDSTLWCWGDNTYGQAHPGLTTNEPTPTLIEVGAPFEHVAVGTNHSCGLTTGGTVYCWGANSAGQSGSTALGTNVAPLAVDGSYLSIGAGDQTTCALDANHHVACWGVNRGGQLGRGGSGNSSSVPSQIANNIEYAALAVGWSGACAVTMTGTLDCWGDNNGTGLYAAPTPMAGGPATWTAISVGRTHLCGLGTVGDMYCNGDGSSGQLANGSGATTAPIRVATAVIDVGVGAASTCVVLGDHTARCWGDNVGGELGTGDYARTLAPTPVLTQLAWKTIRPGRDHTCALQRGGVNDGTAWCWGNNPYGEIGNGTMAGTPLPASTTIGPFTALSLGDQHTCGVVGTQGLCWGNGAQGQLAMTVPLEVVPTVIGKANSAMTFSTGFEFTCFVVSGKVSCAGANKSDQLANPGAGDGTANASVIAGQGNLVFTQISSGREHTCGLVGTHIYCWGRDYEGELGDGRNVKSSPMATLVPGDSVYTAVVSGAYFTCGLVSNGAVDCWGMNDRGQLGDGTLDDHHSPKPVTGLTNVVAIAAGGSTTCALMSGELDCWGDNGYGQLGTGVGWTADFVTVALP